MKNKRALVSGIAVLFMVGTLCACVYHNEIRNKFYTLLTPQSGAQSITPDQAHIQAKNAPIILIDIRRPDEWKKTGVWQGAHRLDLRREDFVNELQRLQARQPNTPFALICARGVRSARLSRRLLSIGFDNIIDVPEGMLGSGAGPGWIARGLPLVK